MGSTRGGRRDLTVVVANEWTPRAALSSKEEALLKLCKKQKLWAFFRHNREKLLDEDVRAALKRMYAGESARGGRPPVSPEKLALAMLLQIAFGVADHEVPTLTAVDRRWQMVLDCMDAEKPAFSQGTVFEFRERMRSNGLMQVLLNKTVELARTANGFSHKRLHAIFDSSPLVGAGRVEDSFNLIGRAIAQLLEAAAQEGAFDPKKVAKDMNVTVFSSSSVKAVLDVDWRKPESRSAALAALLGQFERLRDWLNEYFGEDKLGQPPLAKHVELVEKLIEQDTEPDPDSPKSSGVRRIRQGVSKDRIVSLSDPDMRHGRKSKTKAFSGYKRHISLDADVQGLICATDVQPANKREYDGAAPLMAAIAEAGLSLVELDVDRGYIPAQEILQARDNGLVVVSKPPTPARSPHFSKYEFPIDFDKGTVACPAGFVMPLASPKTAFPATQCGPCKLRSKCTTSSRRTITIHPQERWYREMAEDLGTPAGRARRRARIPVEHALARVSALQGNRARFRGIDKNQFDLTRTAVVSNCYVLARIWGNAA